MPRAARSKVWRHFENIQLADDDHHVLCILCKQLYQNKKTFIKVAAWLAGTKNHLNLKMLVPNFVPRGFKARRRWGFEAGRSGVSRHGKRGFEAVRGTAENDKALRCSVSVAAPRNPTSPPLETSPCLETPPAVPRNPTFTAPRNPWGQNLGPKFLSLGRF